MNIYFGLDFDQIVHPELQNSGTWYCGTKKLLHFLETHLGLLGHPTNNEFLRIEQFRQAIQKHLHHSHQEASTVRPFYARSFEADPLATATNLLERRDELILEGWDFIVNNDTPNRLKTISELEFLAQSTEHTTGIGLTMGNADRWRTIENELEKRKVPIHQFFLHEPLELLPHFLQRIISLIKLQHIKVSQLNISPPISNKTKTDLDFFGNCLVASARSKEAQADGSIIILRAKRAHSLATFVAKLCKKNPTYRPLCLIPEKNRALDNAIFQEGLPSLGILSDSLARPSLQILKLVPTFLWHPIDPYKLMEFVSLSVKPLEDELANRIAQKLADTPGIGGDRWRVMIAQYFDEMREKIKTDKNIDLQEVEEQYRFWFQRRRYDISQTVPREEAAEIFDFVAKWAKKVYDTDKSPQKPTSILVLREQAIRIVELIETLPPQEKSLSFLQLERIVRTIYEPSPVTFRVREVGNISYIHQSSAMAAPTNELLWWNFIDNEPPYFFSKWYQNEIQYLKNSQVYLETPTQKNKRLLWQRIRPIIYTQKQVIFCLPDTIDGSEARPHPLLGNLNACFQNINAITFDVDTFENAIYLERIGFELPTKILLENKALAEPQPFLHIQNEEVSQPRESESYSSLSDLLYYPYKWVFKYKLKLNKSSILSIVKDHTLQGNLAHRVFEHLFKNHPNILEWTAQEITKEVDELSNYYMQREGAVLLMYGREPDRAAFISKIKLAACTLIDMIRNNGWRVKAVEQRLDKPFLNIEIKGITDLVLENDAGELAVVDLKWRGASRRFQLIRSNEDLQLVLYSKLLMENEAWAHTAFFIMEQGKMIARNNKAFREATAVSPDANHEAIHQEIWDRMTATYQWRVSQLAEGRVEVRTEQTNRDIEATFNADEIMELLEMKSTNAPFDDFRTLIGLYE